MPLSSIAKVSLLPPCRHSRWLADDIVVDIESVSRVKGDIAGATLSKDGRAGRRRGEDGRERDEGCHDAAHRVSGIERCH